MTKNKNVALFFISGTVPIDPRVRPERMLEASDHCGAVGQEMRPEPSLLRRGQRLCACLPLLREVPGVRLYQDRGRRSFLREHATLSRRARLLFQVGSQSAHKKMNTKSLYSLKK